MEYPVIIPICEDCPVKGKLSMRNRQIRDLRRTLRDSRDALDRIANGQGIVDTEDTLALRQVAREILPAEETAAFERARAYLHSISEPLSLG
jgi:hypothetical protein